MLIGYMRVSKADGSQVLDLQRDALLSSTFRILRCMAEGVRKSLQECGRDLYGFRAGPGHG